MPDVPFHTRLGAPTLSTAVFQDIGKCRWHRPDRPGAPAAQVCGWLTYLLPSLPSGLESVDHYPILVAVTGILVRLLVHGPASG